MVGRGQHRVQQQLPVLGPRIALADPGIAGQDVVTVHGRVAREHAVVQAQQAHHPMRDRPHRHHGAHRERPGAEVGPRRTAGQPRS